MPDEEDSKRRTRERLEEWIRMNRAETARRDLSDAAPEASNLDASATQLEAIDRAAHIPPFSGQEREGAFSPEERQLLSESHQELNDIYPTAEAYRESFPRVAPPPPGTWERDQYDDFEQMDTEERKRKSVTPEQKANVDKALADVKLSDAIGGASDATSKPRPADPQPTQNAKDIGKDLNKAGVVMDR